MPVRNRNGKLEWRFKIDGHEFSRITNLADTKRNRIECGRQEAEARRLVLDGRGSELRLQVEPFDSAATAFITWAKGEYADHPNSWKRLRGSMTSATQFFGRRPLASINSGDLDDYKSHRRASAKVREVTLRHDLHALSLLFQYGQKHKWCRSNPVREVEIPSDADATRCNVLSPTDEMKYFDVIDGLMAGKKRQLDRQALQDIRDLSTLMLNQGCRPEELRELRQEGVDLERSLLTIQKGKSAAAKRTLPITAACRDVLVRRLQTPGPWVFPSPRHPSKHIGQAQRMVEAVIAKSGIPMVLYDLRHTFATRAVERGIELPKLMAVLGHSNLRSIMRYVHMSSDHVADAMRRFEAGGPVVAEALAPAVEGRKETIQ